MKTDTERAKLFIKQTWRFQNLSTEFAVEFRQRFEGVLEPADDATRAKRLIQQNAVEQLEALKDLVDPLVTSYIDDFLKKANKTKSSGFSTETLHDVQQRLNIVQNLVDSKKYLQAASILAMTNRDDEQFATQFYDLRRQVAYYVLRAGKYKLSYITMSMHKVAADSGKEEYAKAEWLLGYISYRFLDKYADAIKHFEAAYNTSKAAIRLSKNAFWLAEVHRAKNDVVLAVDWYKKAEEHFHTFYGYMAHARLSKLLPEQSTKIYDVYDGSDVVLASREQEMLFYNRELVQVLIEISKHPAEKAYIKPFVLQLVDEIEDPNEELLLANLPIVTDEIDLVGLLAIRKQHFVKGKWKTLDDEQIGYIKRVNPNDQCLITFAHAIIRRESNFDPNATSYVGASGFMQVMPATAEYEIKRITFYKGDSVPLNDPEKNIIIGSFILNRLLKKYNNNLVFVAAAYNCGEGNLSKFLKSVKEVRKLKMIDLIEMIPYKETRIYVKCVLRNLAEYQKIFKTTGCYNFENIIGLE
jgi:soluble lytic murein transglycosylase